MAHTKAIGTTKLGRDSESKRLGVKIQDGQAVKIGNIIIRQRGSHFIVGRGVKMGKDDTIFATKNGKVKFSTKRKTNFEGNTRYIKVVNVL